MCAGLLNAVVTPHYSSRYATPAIAAGTSWNRIVRHTFVMCKRHRYITETAQIQLVRRRPKICVKIRQDALQSICAYIFGESNSVSIVLQRCVQYRDEPTATLQICLIMALFLPPSRKHLHTKVTPDFHLTYSKNGGNLRSESK